MCATRKTNKKKSSPLPTTSKPSNKAKKSKNTELQYIDYSDQVVADTTSIQTENKATNGNSLGTNLLGLLANVASFNSIEKVDYDKNGKQITDGISYYKRRYRSAANISENEDIKASIERQKQELADERAKDLEEAQNASFTFFTEDDIMGIINTTNDALHSRIFGPMWNNWTNGKDFINDLKNTLQNIIDTFDPLMDLVDQLQEYVNTTVADNLREGNIRMYKTRNGENINLPLGVIALEALNTIIDYIRQLIRNLERLAEEYTVEELNALLKKGTSGSNWGTMIKTIQELIQTIINCIKPYIQNLIIAVILDIIDMIVDVLKKAGLLEPHGPLKLVPIAVTLVRSIMSGDLEAIEEMVKQSVVKLINIFQLMLIAMKDPSILWADTDRMDKEIAIARYNILTENGTKPLDEDAFFNHTDVNITSGARHFLQKMKNETAATFDQAKDFAAKWTDANIFYKKETALTLQENNNQTSTDTAISEANSKSTTMSNSIKSNVKEIPVK